MEKPPGMCCTFLSIILNNYEIGCKKRQSLQERRELPQEKRVIFLYTFKEEMEK